MRSERQALADALVDEHANLAAMHWQHAAATLAAVTAEGIERPITLVRRGMLRRRRPVLMWAPSLDELHAGIEAHCPEPDYPVDPVVSLHRLHTAGLITLNPRSQRRMYNELGAVRARLNIDAPTSFDDRYVVVVHAHHPVHPVVRLLRQLRHRLRVEHRLRIDPGPTVDPDAPTPADWTEPIGPPPAPACPDDLATLADLDDLDDRGEQR